MVKGWLSYFDYRLFFTVVMLTFFGLLFIYSADHSQGIKSHFYKQIYFSSAGLLLLIGIAAIPSRIYEGLAYIIYALCILLLVFVPLAGIIGFGARRWLFIGGMNIQPSEPMKLALIFVLSSVLSQRHSNISIGRILWKTGALTVLPTILVLMQPDLGTATVFPVIAAAMLAWYGLPLKVFILLLLPVSALFLLVSPWLIIILLTGGLILLWKAGIRWFGIAGMIILCTVAAFTAPLVWNQLEPYQQKRLTTFLNPAADPLGSGYQIIQSKVAVGSGGFKGQGFLKGTQTQLRFLPEQHTDFIFALAGEEFGFIGTSAIILLFLIFSWSGFLLASRCRNQFQSLTAVGVTTLILYHSVVNIGMVIGVLPVTGLPLPFLSYGGSFLLTCLTGTGILLSIGLRRREH